MRLTAKSTEKAARHLYALFTTDGDPTWEQLPEATRVVWRWKARVVVYAAIPELSDNKSPRINEINLKDKP